MTDHLLSASKIAKAANRNIQESKAISPFLGNSLASYTFGCFLFGRYASLIFWASIRQFICTFTFSLILLSSAIAAPNEDPEVPGLLRVRFAAQVKSIEADALIQALGYKTSTRSGFHASPQWRRIKITPFTEKKVTKELKSVPQIVDVRVVTLSEIYNRDRGVSVKTAVRKIIPQPLSTTQLQESDVNYIDKIKAKYVSRFGTSFKCDESDSVTLKCRIKSLGNITANPQNMEVIECVFILTDSQLFLCVDGTFYERRYAPNPPTEVVKPFVGEYKPGLNDFASDLLALARSVFP